MARDDWEIAPDPEEAFRCAFDRAAGGAPADGAEDIAVSAFGRSRLARRRAREGAAGGVRAFQDRSKK